MMKFTDITEILSQYYDPKMNNLIIPNEDYWKIKASVLSEFNRDNKGLIGGWESPTDDENDDYYWMAFESDVDTNTVIAYHLEDTDAHTELVKLISKYGKDAVIEYIESMEV